LCKVEGKCLESCGLCAGIPEPDSLRNDWSTRPKTTPMFRMCDCGTLGLIMTNCEACGKMLTFKHKKEVL
jgi:hypothetical protein